ncbi:ribosomal protein S18 acetylase RimI-like enzyme [Rhizomicrobium palustre]|uniref:Ribosomal protein S18 acetylase RimI-like enzyme n=1 Tax=Rhizomicrobium palustre TaxID=189966 RepID=A0A846MYV9_9PROT|nr:GNAT family N-acetyltransferase [Rhizomicrobium palustre]NIK88137.1 ribosomal protein S18 acetylase RimI-like enzyme [Rhizomicrobium palustre]
MQNLGQHPVNNAAETIERLSLLTWPGVESVEFQGWRLRFAGAKGHRPNSVAVLDFSGPDLEVAIAHVEAAYAARGLKPMFALHPAAKPAALEKMLDVRGYRAEGHSLVYTAQASEIAEASSDVRFDAPEDFARLVRLGSKSPEDGEERLAVVARLAIPNTAAVAFHEGVGRACGHIGLAHDGDMKMAAINLVRTDPSFRRCGLARKVVQALAGWAQNQACDFLTLCVEETNTPARRLYESLGFKALYGYHYRVKG